MNTTRTRTCGILLVVLILVGLATQAEAGWKNPKAQPHPKAKPQRRTAAESFPPLPLPATPLRRSERKRQPSPPNLIGMINFSERKFVQKDGKRVAASAFPTTVIDIERLISYANSRLNIRYRYVPIQLAKFSWDPKTLPLLYITGWTAMPKLSDETILNLRRYLYNGGTLVIHAQCGREEFRTTAIREMKRIFPNRQLSAIDTDSPLFSAYFPIKTMRVRKDSEPFQEMKPYIEAAYLGCRPAIIYSPIDLNCGWDVARRPIEGGVLYHQDDAIKLGVNIITSVLANMQYARAWGVGKIYHQQGKPSGDQLVIGQIIHNGDWDPTTHGLPNLMKYIARNTTLKVQFKREVVELGSAKLFKYPVLYMTGLRDFKLTKAEVAQLRKYILGGGVLIADSAAGRKAFDVAFRRELKRAL
ncbi:MAG: DUF4159 domain-containing protein, partial [bacterium]|nr:DUF4159 domain-containing protein [bacterium]